LSQAQDLPELFPGFHRQTIEVAGAHIHVRRGGSGPPLLLLHGYPQTHAMWHRVAPALAARFSLVIADLRGYGQSSCPAGDRAHEGYSKRAMAKDMVEAMAALGHRRFAVAGHDRGGRVAYRMTLDHPGEVSRLAVLDIVPTHTMWHGLDMQLALKTYHWMFLAQPEPFPETMIAGAPLLHLEHTLASWTKDKSLAAFSDGALAHYRAACHDAERIHAWCEDYRAGASCDLAADEADRAAGRRIACPLLALWGSAGIPSETEGPLEVWREWADEVEGEAIDAGHFLCEENPDATVAAMLPFFSA
jgi:haloacetate dehalogenase